MASCAVETTEGDNEEGQPDVRYLFTPRHARNCRWRPRGVVRRRVRVVPFPRAILPTRAVQVELDPASVRDAERMAVTVSSNSSFVHLHVHTEYSMLDGASLLDGLFSRVSELEMPAIAMTDHGNLHGAYDFWSKARQHGVKPIIGIEAYLTPQTHRSERRRVRWGKGSSEEEGGDDVAGAAPTPT